MIIYIYWGVFVISILWLISLTLYDFVIDKNKGVKVLIPNRPNDIVIAKNIHSKLYCDASKSLRIFDFKNDKMYDDNDFIEILEKRDFFEKIKSKDFKLCVIFPDGYDESLFEKKCMESLGEEKFKQSFHYVEEGEMAFNHIKIVDETFVHLSIHNSNSVLSTDINYSLIAVNSSKKAEEKWKSVVGDINLN